VKHQSVQCQAARLLRIGTDRGLGDFPKLGCTYSLAETRRAPSLRFWEVGKTTELPRDLLLQLFHGIFDSTKPPG